MDTILPILAGAIFATGIYLLLRRSLILTIIGIILISNSVNLALFSLGRLNIENPPLIAAGSVVPEAPFANPLPQALILTAIVIGFGLLAFALALAYRSYKELGTVDQDSMLEDPEDTSAAIVNESENREEKEG
ncbi:NADH-quinone oxidoreductase subunit K [Natronogracilivirga saccharolytica]|uniref:NADH-quinone oxidoreductase subunit K n=1 Tax=Natronogracilivirga saccharolytica TaxID=2812953 RepID=A0A8J7RL49_9BACT|nr:NADH-quinone oxidoreductase subunit K [Natronogracilivirga saccharolytica]MBP3191689.1 NADH-quinone oxidoreductase subunit K [Natronogracilivirga saccharolytica]